MAKIKRINGGKEGGTDKGKKVFINNLKMIHGQQQDPHSVPCRLICYRVRGTSTTRSSPLDVICPPRIYKYCPTSPFRRASSTINSSGDFTYSFTTLLLHPFSLSCLVVYVSGTLPLLDLHRLTVFLLSTPTLYYSFPVSLSSCTGSSSVPGRVCPGTSGTPSIHITLKRPSKTCPLTVPVGLLSRKRG